MTQGWLLLEHGYDQAEAVRELFIQYGYESVTTYKDLAGLSRVTAGQLNNSSELSEKPCKKPSRLIERSSATKLPKP